MTYTIKAPPDGGEAFLAKWGRPLDARTRAMAASQLNVYPYLLQALRSIEEHHVAKIARAGLSELDSTTLRIVRAALAKAPDR